MDELLLVGLAGFAASFVDGALGMGFGPTSSSILLATSLSPSAASATVNLAKVATGIASAISHLRFGNVERRIVLALAIPGALGALIGATVLAQLDGRSVRPYLALLLVAVALRILLRFSQVLRVVDSVVQPSVAEPGQLEPQPESNPVGRIGVALAGVMGGVTNALVGAWGPIVTPYLLHRGVKPRIAVGSVNTAEVAVAAMSAGTLLATFGSNRLNIPMLLAMLVGGVLAAPVSAWAVRRLPARGMGLAVAGLLLFTNVVELVAWAKLGGVRFALYAVVPALVVAAALAPRWRARTQAVL